MTFLLGKWLQGMKPKAVPGARARRGAKRSRPHRIVPRLEVLEDRTVPSTLTVINNLDTGVACCQTHDGRGELGADVRRIGGRRDVGQAVAEISGDAGRRPAPGRIGTGLVAPNPARGGHVGPAVGGGNGHPSSRVRAAPIRAARKAARRAKSAA